LRVGFRFPFTLLAASRKLKSTCAGTR